MIDRDYNPECTRPETSTKIAASYGQTGERFFSTN
jgi:hypothetical protein